MGSRSTPLAVRVLALAITPFLAACVTERSPSSYGGVPFSASKRSGAAPTPATAPASLPSGPVARPVTPQAPVSASVRTSLMDLGTVPYDGLVLPLISPDGRFLASQTGVAPTWPTLLAAPGAEVPLASQVLAFRLPEPAAANPGAQPPGAQPIAWNEPLNGLLLGRSCDTTGFLVEAPQPDGSRWIGYASWISGSIEWLVRNDDVNAYASFGPDGELAYCRRGVDSTAIQLVVRPRSKDATELTLSAGAGAGAYLWPLFSDEPGIVYATSLVAGAAELHALRLPQRGEPPTLVIVGRQPLSRGTNAADLYQMTASVQTPLPSSLTNSSPDRQDTRFDKLIFFHPAHGRMTVFDRRLGALVPLFPGSFGATPIASPEGQSPPRSGYLIATSRGLEYVALSQKSDFDVKRGVPASTEEGIGVVSGAYLPRLTTMPGWPGVLLGPAPGAQAGRIHLFRLKLE
jgi:hypothetical protein